MCVPFFFISKFKIENCWLSLIKTIPKQLNPTDKNRTCADTLTAPCCDTEVSIIPNGYHKGSWTHQNYQLN